MTESNSYVGAANSEELAVSDLWSVLFRHKAIFLATVLFCVAIGILLSLAPRKYAADSMLRVQPGATSQYRASQVAPASVEIADQIAPYVDILQSRTLYLKVAKDLDLANTPEFGGGKAGRRESLDEPLVRDRTLAEMRAKIAVVHKPKDEIIRVTATTISPALSAKLVNTLINDYVEYLFETRYGASKRASGWLEKQLDDLKQQVENDQTALTSLQAKLGFIGMNETGNDSLFAQSLTTIGKAASDATVERIVAEAKYRFLQESDPNLIEGEVNLLGGSGASGSSTSSLLQSLRSAQATQSSNYARLLAQFGPNYPEIKELKSQLDETTRQVKAEQSRILNQARLSYSAATANEQMTEKALSGKQGQAFSQRGDMVKYIILLHDYQAHRTLYEGLISRLQEAGITAGLEGGEVDIVDLADVPTKPAPPGRLTFYIGSLLAGLFLGFILALIAEALNTRIQTPEQARRASSFPALGMLPHLRRGHSLSESMGDSPYMEAIDSVRASLFNAGAASPPHKVLVLTSAQPGEGKSTTALYLAAVLAQHGAKVLLLDCDLRQGTLATKLDLAATPGLAEVLAGKSAFADSVHSVASLPNLRVVVSGARPDVRAGVLLDSPQMRNVLTAARESFDYVVLNSPPTLGFSDVLSLGHLADGTVLVMRNGLTGRAVVKRSETVLRGAGVPVYGYILNDVSLGHQGIAYRGYRRMYTADARGTA